MTASVFVFNGDLQETGNADDDELVFGANLDYAVEDFTGGISWDSGMDSNRLADLPGTIDDPVMGLGLYAIWQMDKLAVIVEHIQALDDFNNGDFAGAVNGDRQPSATNVEVAYPVDEQSTVAVSFQATDDAAFYGLPRTALLFGYTTTQVRDMKLGLEFATVNDYGPGDGGADDDGSRLLLQASTEF